MRGPAAAAGALRQQRRSLVRAAAGPWAPAAAERRRGLLRGRRTVRAPSRRRRDALCSACGAVCSAAALQALMLGAVIFAIYRWRPGPSMRPCMRRAMRGRRQGRRAAVGEQAPPQQLGRAHRQPRPRQHAARMAAQLARTPRPAHTAPPAPASTGIMSGACAHSLLARASSAVRQPTCYVTCAGATGLEYVLSACLLHSRLL